MKLKEIFFRAQPFNPSKPPDTYIFDTPGEHSLSLPVGAYIRYQVIGADGGKSGNSYAQYSSSQQRWTGTGVNGEKGHSVTGEMYVTGDIAITVGAVGGNASNSRINIGGYYITTGGTGGAGYTSGGNGGGSAGYGVQSYRENQGGAGGGAGGSSAIIMLGDVIESLGGAGAGGAGAGQSGAMYGCGGGGGGYSNGSNGQNAYTGSTSANIEWTSRGANGGTGGSAGNRGGASNLYQCSNGQSGALNGLSLGNTTGGTGQGNGNGTGNLQNGKVIITVLR